jgi:hypothetical protein
MAEIRNTASASRSVPIVAGSITCAAWQPNPRPARTATTRSLGPGHAGAEPSGAGAPGDRDAAERARHRHRRVAARGHFGPLDLRGAVPDPPGARRRHPAGGRAGDLPRADHPARRAVRDARGESFTCVIEPDPRSGPGGAAGRAGGGARRHGVEGHEGRPGHPRVRAGGRCPHGGRSRGPPGTSRWPSQSQAARAARPAPAGARGVAGQGGPPRPRRGVRDDPALPSYLRGGAFCGTAHQPACPSQYLRRLTET